MVDRRSTSRRLRVPASKQAISPEQIMYLTGGEGAARVASRDEALSLPVFGRGVELLASAVAGVELVAQRWDRDAGIWARIPTQPVVLTDPDPLQTAWHWRYACVKDLIEAGNHLAILGEPDSDGWPSYLVPVPVSSVAVVEPTSTRSGYGFMVGVTLYDATEVLHISAGNRGGSLLGQGVVSQYAGALGQELTAEEWSARYLAGGGLPPAIIQAAGTPTQAQMEDFKSRWNALTTTGEAIIIPASATVTPLQSDAQAQQLVEARTWNAQLQAIMLGIPTHMVGLPGPSMTYQNVETADIGWIKDSVSRWAQPVESTVGKVLLPRGQRARFDWAGRLRTDQKTQVEVVTQYVAGGVWSVDEGRQAIGYPPAVQSVEVGSTPVGVPELGAKEVG